MLRFVGEIMLSGTLSGVGFWLAFPDGSFRQLVGLALFALGVVVVWRKP